MSDARIYLHPRCFARRAAEIAESQGGGKLGRDACGRPFILAPDPLVAPGAEPQAEPGREGRPPPTLPPQLPLGSAQGRRSLDRLIRALLAWLPPPQLPLGEAPGRVYREEGTG